jgi:hypothetical protein
VSETQALAIMRGIFAAVGIISACILLRRAHGDLGRAEQMATAGRARNDERMRRILRMHGLSRRAWAYLAMLAGLAVVAVMAFNGHPWLATASNLNQIMDAAIISLLAILELHDRTSQVLLTQAGETASEEPTP